MKQVPQPVPSYHFETTEDDVPPPIDTEDDVSPRTKINASEFIDAHLDHVLHFEN